MIKKHKKLILKVIIAIIFIVGIIYGIYSYIDNIRKQGYVKVIINGQEIMLTSETNNLEAINLETLNVEYDIIIDIDKKHTKLKINDEEIQESQVNLGKIAINNENKIKIDIKFFGDLKYTPYEINTVPSDFIKYETEGAVNEDKEFYLTSFITIGGNKNYYVYKINNEGHITFYKKTAYKAFNFKKAEFDGKVRYTYLEATNKQIRYDGVITCLPATLVVLNENYETINEIDYDEKQNIYTDNHDYIYFDDNHYIICGYTKEKVKNIPGTGNKELLVWNCRLKEVKDGKTLWEFQSIENEKLYGYYNEKRRKTSPYTSYEAINYMHFNSMDIDPKDGNLICSFREQNSVIKISRKTGKVIWILGGTGDQFNLKENQKFYKQHSVSILKDRSILIYDNSGTKEKTRILKIKVDEKTKKVKEFKEYDLKIYIPSMGDVQVVNEKEDIYRITYGMGARKYAFEEKNIETNESIYKFRITNSSNYLYCVNKFKK